MTREPGEGISETLEPTSATIPAASDLTTVGYSGTGGIPKSRWT